MSEINVDDMVKAYVEAQLWAQHDYEREDECLDANYDTSDVSPAYVTSVRDELQSVIDGWPELVRAYHDTDDSDARREWSRSELFGHDFYLTREHHGAGFWDRGLGELGNKLTDVAHSFGSANELFDNGTGVLIGSQPV